MVGKREMVERRSLIENWEKEDNMEEKKQQETRKQLIKQIWHMGQTNLMVPTSVSFTCNLCVSAAAFCLLATNWSNTLSYSF